MSLIELLIVTIVLTAVILIVTSVLLSSGHAESKTVFRATAQADCRQALYLMTTELRQAGADPSDPPVGVIPIVAGQEDMIHIRADLNGNGVIQTAEPSEDVTYSYDSTARVVTRDPGSGPAVVLTNVTNMSLSYFDDANQPVTPLPLSATDAARVRSIGLTITARNHDSQPITLTARITLRNT